jgi:hypothetical protein
MDSPTHRANILGANYTEIGVGLATGTYQGGEAVFVVQFFAAPQRNSEPSVVATNEEPVVAGTGTQVSVVAAGQEAESAVLGAATPAAPTLSFVDRVASSPRTFASYALAALALFFAALLLIGIVPVRKHTHHGLAVLNGVFLVVVLVSLLYINRTYLVPSVSVPANTLGASVVTGLSLTDH